MRVALIKNGLKKVLDKKPTMISDEQWQDLDEKAMSAIQLCLTKEVLREIIHEETTAALWTKLESLYMTKVLPTNCVLRKGFTHYAWKKVLPSKPS